ncbi:phosphoglycerate transporter [Brachybacterium sp. NBEC-018]|uniref:phosphoglycerate transporter n=1 Tax=Brachybacterium sp. NBEC-018 TaxID=2996004 RepID=UPI002174D4DD|nr:phosphoglycerate transporter [Brachybacterium sp. NBEC-018]UVY85366.1 phosphoglycerate transporter [Brachybacterium sp. NBEC-018]
MDAQEVAAIVGETRRRAGRPVVVGVSGFGGSGKSTVARWLESEVEGAVRMRGDDFLDPSRSHRRSSDWDGVERERLARDVLVPFRERRDSTFRRYDWALRALGEPEPVPRGDVMIVDLIGLFHPATAPALDLRIWCDVDLATATTRGRARDAEIGRDHEQLWQEIWVPNERDFVERFDPRSMADVRFTGSVPGVPKTGA